MIDTEARRRAYHALTRFVDGQTTNDEFEEEYPDVSRTSDRALRAIESMVWHFYRDNVVHRLEGEYAPNTDGKTLLRRCLDFLQSSTEYTWSENNFIAVCSAALDEMITDGSIDIWPFPVDGQSTGKRSPRG